MKCGKNITLQKILVMTQSGNTQSVVWIVDDTVPALRAFDAGTGVEVYSSATRPSDALGAVPHFPPISCGGSSVFVGVMDGLALYAAQVV